MEFSNSSLLSPLPPVKKLPFCSASHLCALCAFARDNPLVWIFYISSCAFFAVKFSFSPIP
jgi:hypothetical protein